MQREILEHENNRDKAEKMGIGDNGKDKVTRGPSELHGGVRARTQFCQKLPAATGRFQDWGLILLMFASPCAQGHGSSANKHLLSLLF